MITDQIKELLLNHSVYSKCFDRAIELNLPEKANKAHCKKVECIARIETLLKDLEKQDAEQFKKIGTGVHSVSPCQQRQRLTAPVL